MSLTSWTRPRPPFLPTGFQPSHVLPQRPRCQVRPRCRFGGLSSGTNRLRLESLRDTEFTKLASLSCPATSSPCLAANMGLFLDSIFKIGECDCGKLPPPVSSDPERPRQRTGSRKGHQKSVGNLSLGRTLKSLLSDPSFLGSLCLRCQPNQALRDVFSNMSFQTNNGK